MVLIFLCCDDVIWLRSLIFSGTYLSNAIDVFAHAAQFVILLIKVHFISFDKVVILQNIMYIIGTVRKQWLIENRYISANMFRIRQMKNNICLLNCRNVSGGLYPHIFPDVLLCSEGRLLAEPGTWTCKAFVFFISFVLLKP